MPTTPPNELQLALEAFTRVAVDSFNAGYADATAAPPPAPVPPTTQSEQAQKDWATKTGKGKSQMSSALQQLVQAETMRSDQRGRDGYDAIVTLMTDAQTTASAIFTLVQQLVDWSTLPAADPDRQNEFARRTSLLGVLNTALDNLGRIAPIAVWQKPTSSSTGA